MTNEMTAKPDDIFERRESSVRSYCRSFPVTFAKAEGSWIHDREGNKYLDFLAGCGSLNYGHNDPDMKAALIDYIGGSNIAHGLDMYTGAKEAFLKAFEQYILKPRDLDYRVMFTGPTGANAVEAAMKLARLSTGRKTIVNFSNSFHGMTLGALAVTCNRGKRAGAGGVTLGNNAIAPFDGYYGEGVDTTEFLDRMLSDPSSGVDMPAAVIVECIQGEGGLRAASAEWLRKLEKVCRKHGVLIIADDIQAGCGRSGDYFAFEEAGIEPDLVTQAKSISGFGLPMALTLVKAELDIFKPAQHNGTFRGNNHAFVTGAVALEKFWKDDSFSKSVKAKGKILRQRFEGMVERFARDGDLSLRGRGMMQGIVFPDGEEADKVTAEAFERGLIIETSGGNDEVVKVLCALTISEEDLNRGLDILEDSIAAVRGGKASAKAAE
ncbi:diaminobutyrate--2-oxoglutarate transaminase [Marivibrio halodurans]|uniref:Diaminobutyrate--2-oxoglutarate transaminase n=1 Tax=Marivibrio halodurans TaxID=2039722 RepID=A0A8J7V246_9PROT|nr:diaminobutyrate--2-oxoglutarate transaminase [Marivibrio halodurans]MBP5856995.1 diaminobutyrate--2-oxoglutarate transaminase [Marivibrio halodurans]